MNRKRILNIAIFLCPLLIFSQTSPIVHKGLFSIATPYVIGSKDNNIYYLTDKQTIVEYNKAAGTYQKLSAPKGINLDPENQHIRSLRISDKNWIIGTRYRFHDKAQTVTYYLFDVEKITFKPLTDSYGLFDDNVAYKTIGDSLYCISAFYDVGMPADSGVSVNSVITIETIDKDGNVKKLVEQKNWLKNVDLKNLSGAFGSSRFNYICNQYDISIALAYNSSEPVKGERNYSISIFNYNLKSGRKYSVVKDCPAKISNISLYYNHDSLFVIPIYKFSHKEFGELFQDKIYGNKIRLNSDKIVGEPGKWKELGNEESIPPISEGHGMNHNLKISADDKFNILITKLNDQPELQFFTGKHTAFGYYDTTYFGNVRTLSGGNNLGVSIDLIQSVGVGVYSTRISRENGSTQESYSTTLIRNGAVLRYFTNGNMNTLFIPSVFRASFNSGANIAAMTLEDYDAMEDYRFVRGNVTENDQFAVIILAAGTSGTEYSTVYDIITVNKLSKKIKFIRKPAGSNEVIMPASALIENNTLYLGHTVDSHKIRVEALVLE